MAETTQLELVTPANIMVQKAAEMVVAPGAEGLFGAMPRHAPLLSDHPYLSLKTDRADDANRDEKIAWLHQNW